MEHLLQFGPDPCPRQNHCFSRTRDLVLLATSPLSFDIHSKVSYL